MSWSNRKPYLSLEKSPTQFFSAFVRYLKESNEKESQFEKPYQSLGEYQVMHLNLPWPKLTGRGLSGTGGAGKSGYNTQPDTNPRKLDSQLSRPCEFHWPLPAEVETDVWYVCRAYFAAPNQVRKVEVEAGKAKVASTYTVSGTVVTISVKVEDLNGADGQIVLNVTVWMTQDSHFINYGESANVGTPAGLAQLQCITSALVEACVPDSSMAWDYDTSAETVAQSNSCTVAVEGANGPFTWSVSGTGFSLDSEVTVGLTNTLNAGAAACGSATITVTGCDETVVTGYVRCTTGTWHLRVDLDGTCPFDNYPTYTSVEYSIPYDRMYNTISGKYKARTRMLWSSHETLSGCESGIASCLSNHDGDCIDPCCYSRPYTWCQCELAGDGRYRKGYAQYGEVYDWVCS